MNLELSTHILVQIADGMVQEILSPADVRLNQPSKQVIERERAYHQKRQEEAKGNRARNAERRRLAEEEAAKAAILAEVQRKAAEEIAARIAAEQAEKPLNPHRVRRMTVRRRIVETEPAEKQTVRPSSKYKRSESPYNLRNLGQATLRVAIPSLAQFRRASRCFPAVYTRSQR